MLKKLDHTTCVKAQLTAAVRQLQSASGSPRLDAEILLAQVLNKPRSYLYSWPDAQLTEYQHQQFQRLIDKRSKGEPIAYLTGRREFWSLELVVTAATLIPRPETELLVGLALQHIPVNQPLRIADLGTGSGGIAIAIASERPLAQIIATDSSPQALAIAQQNNNRLLKNSQVTFITSDWFSALKGELFDLIISNPPYIATHSPYLSQGDLRFEPQQALCSGIDGLDAIRHIVTHSPSFLRQGGQLFLEHGFDHADAVQDLMLSAKFTAVASYQDDSAIVRVTHGRRN